MHLPEFGKKIERDEIRLVGGPPTQTLLPLKYVWLYEIFKKANNNFWLPEEISMGVDKSEYAKLPPNVKHAYDWLFSMLTTMDLIVTDSLETNIMPHATAPEFRSWLALQGYQEAIHTHSYVIIAEEVSLDPEDVFERYLKEEPLYNKIAMAKKYSDLLDRANTTKISGLRDFIVGYAFWAIVLEGVWFYMGLSAGTYPAMYHRMMRGTADQFQYIRRDESLHYSTGISILQEIIKEYPEILDADTKERIIETVKTGVELEEVFALNCYKNLPGLSAHDYIHHVKYQAEKCINRLGISIFKHTKPALTWISSSVEIKKEANFFERRVTEYQASVGLDFNDDNNIINAVHDWEEEMKNG